MTTDPSGPADTTMMRIVHSALRRDLARAQAALSALPYPDGAQRRALCDHLRWMMGFLHHHHDFEDQHLFPLARTASRGAAGILDDMSADHSAIATGIAAVEHATERYAESPDAREDLVSSIDALTAVLLPHLRREEDEAMPVVSAAVTQQQWDEVEHTYNVAPLSLREKAFTGNWFIDDVSAEDEAIVAALVPPVPRWIVRNVFIHPYRRRAFRCWQLQQHSGIKTTLTGAVTAYSEATPDEVWHVLADVTRVGEWSHECHAAEWTDGSTAAAVGAQFRGRSRSGRVQWSRSCTVHVCRPGVEFGYLTQGRLLRDSTEWLWTLRPEGTGTRITQHYRIRSLPRYADRIVWLATPAHHDRLPALTADIERLAQLATSESQVRKPRATTAAD